MKLHICRPKVVGTMIVKWTISGGLSEKGVLKCEEIAECQRCGQLFHYLASWCRMPPSWPTDTIVWWTPDQFRATGAKVPRRVLERAA